MANTEAPGRYEVTDQQIQATLDRVQRSFPAIVVSYDAQTLRAEVQPALRIASSNGQQITPSPVVVPVAWPSWGGFGLLAKLAAGDEVIVECMDRNWLAWLKAGGVADYNAIGGRGAGYGVAKPVQVSNVRRPSPLGPGEAVRFGALDGSSTIVLMDSGELRAQSASVRLGSSTSPTLAVARHTDNVLAAAALVTYGNALTVATGVPNPWVVGVTPVGDISATSAEVSST